MRSKLITCLMALLLASPCLAENPRIENDLNFELPSDETQWHIVTKQNNTPVLRFYTYQGTGAWSSLGWTCKFKYSKNDSSTGMYQIAGVSYTNYIDFQATTNSFSAPVDKWYCTVLLSTGVLNVSQASGILTIERAPELSATPLVYAAPLIDWSRYTFTNTYAYGPYLGGSNVSLRAVGNTNIQYYIDLIMTNIVDLSMYISLTNAVTNTIVKLIAVSNDVVSARTVADAGSNFAYTVWGWGNHALVGYLRSGSNVSVLVNDAGYLTTVTNHNQAWSTITSTPISLYGYGITNLIGDMFKVDNLSGLANYVTARSNLGLGSASTNNNIDFYYAGNPSGFITDAEITGMSSTQAIHSSAITGLANTNETQNTAITGLANTNATQDTAITGLANTNATQDSGITGLSSTSATHTTAITGLANTNETQNTNMTAQITRIGVLETNTASKAQGAKADTALQNFAPFTVVTNMIVTTNIASVVTNLTVEGLTTYSEFNGTSYSWYSADNKYRYLTAWIEISGENWVLKETSLNETGPASSGPPIGEYTGNDTAATVSYTSIVTNYNNTTNYSYIISASYPIEISGITNVPASGINGTIPLGNLPSQVITNNVPALTNGTQSSSAINLSGNLRNGDNTGLGMSISEAGFVTFTVTNYVSNDGSITNTFVMSPSAFSIYGKGTNVNSCPRFNFYRASYVPSTTLLTNSPTGEGLGYLYFRVNTNNNGTPAYAVKASIEAISAETFDVSSNGTKLVFAVTHTGTIALATAFTIDHDRSLKVYNLNADYDPATPTGAGALLFAMTNELYTMDGSGNITKLSSENEKNEMIRQTYNKYSGVLKTFNFETGEYTAITNTPIADWDADETKAVAESIKEIEKWKAEDGKEKPKLYVARPKPKWLVDALKR